MQLHNNICKIHPMQPSGSEAPVLEQASNGRMDTCALSRKLCKASPDLPTHFVDTVRDAFRGIQCVSAAFL